MDNHLKQKLAKVYELVKRGTDGEKQAAQNALDRLIEKYNLDGLDLDSINKTKYDFKYSTNMEMWLILRIVVMFIEDKIAQDSMQRGVKFIRVELTYLDFITVSTAYAYFRRHMKAQWVKTCSLYVKQRRTAKTKAKARAEFQNVFFDKYIIASNLYKPNEIKQIGRQDMSKSEQMARNMITGVEGGAYNRPLSNGLLLEA